MGKSELSVAITGDAAPLDSEMRRAAGGVQNFSGTISSMSAAAAGGIAGLTAAGVKMGVDLVGASLRAASSFAQWGLSMASDAEQAAIGFETMLGSGEKAAKMIADIDKFGAITPFESPELRKAADTLLTYGTSAQQIIPTMQLLGDQAKGNGATLMELSTIYGRLKATGRASMEDINQLSDRGSVGLKDLADHFKVTAAQAKKMVEDGKVGFPDIQKIMVGLTSEGGRFHNSMQKQSESYAGLWSTMSDSVGQAAAEVGKIMMEEFNLKGMLTDGIAVVDMIKKEALPVIKVLAQGFVQTSEWGINSFRSIAASVLDMSADAVRSFSIITDAAKGVLEMMARVADATGFQTTAIGLRAMASMVDQSSIAEGLEKTADELRKPIRQVLGEWRDGLAEAAKNAGEEQGVTAALAIDKAGSKLEKKKEVKDKSPDSLTVGAFDLGSREAFSAINAYRRSGTDKIPEQQLAQQKKTNDLLQRMVDRPSQSIPLIESLV